MVIVVLGGGISSEGALPEHVKKRLLKAKELFETGEYSYIITSGKHSFLYPEEKRPQTTESKKMKEVLIELGVDSEKIKTEENSMDTVGNAYYLKINHFIPEGIFRATIITSKFHIERVEYIFKKVFGHMYSFDFAWTSDELSAEKQEAVVKRQKEVLEKIKVFLLSMEDGAHEFLENELYTNVYYTEPRPKEVIDFVAKGK